MTNWLNQGDGKQRFSKESFDDLLNFWSTIVEWLSFEFVLTKLHRANGGDVILVRAILIASWVSGALWMLPGGIASPRFASFGAIFAAAYAALYARFSQQWHYLANLYNSIKTAEVRAASASQTDEMKAAMAQWKAGFIEDSDVLHLAAKPMIASIICAWATERAVKEAFESFTIGGQDRFAKIHGTAREVCDREGAKWNKP